MDSHVSIPDGKKFPDIFIHAGKKFREIMLQYFLSEYVLRQCQGLGNSKWKFKSGNIPIDWLRPLDNHIMQAEFIRAVVKGDTVSGPSDMYKFPATKSRI
jgi:hypothetical protein